MTHPSDAQSIARAFADPEALGRLARRHRAEARADLSRIHPTWLARALREESPAVRGAVAAHGFAGLCRLLLDDGPLATPDRAPHPEVLSWALALWTERLVGGEDRDDDPPAIVGLMQTSPREAYRLWRWAGRVKAALAVEGGANWVVDRLGSPSDDVREWAARDLKSVEQAGTASSRGEALLGLVTAFRLLPDCEPFAMRRALQRIPYPIVRIARSIAPPTARRAAAAIRLESLILRVAWDRLQSEGRIAIPHPSGGRA